MVISPVLTRPVSSCASLASSSNPEGQREAAEHAHLDLRTAHNIRYVRIYAENNPALRASSRMRAR
jgi:hypothetical protein